jgi:hypothetical protein
MIISAVAVTVLWGAVLAQFPSQRNAPLRRAVWYTMVLLAAIGTLDLTAIGARLDTATGLPNAADVAQHVLAISAATLGWYCAEQVIGGPRRRTRLSGWVQTALPAATVAAMLVLFALSPARTHPTDTARYTDFPMQYAAHPEVFAYWLIFAVYLGTAFTLIAQLAWRYGRRAGRTPLGCGLVLIAAGMMAGLCYLGYGTAEVAARAAGVQGAFISTAPGIIQSLFGALIVLVAVGSLLPATRRCPLLRRLALYWSLRQLYPLWAGLCQAVPGIALDPVPVWAERIDPRDLQMRLYRRVIEIRDGYLALTPVAVPGIEDVVRAAAGRDRLGGRPAGAGPAGGAARRLRRLGLRRWPAAGQPRVPGRHRPGRRGTAAAHGGGALGHGVADGRADRAQPERCAQLKIINKASAGREQSSRPGSQRRESVRRGSDQGDQAG